MQFIDYDLVLSLLTLTFLEIILGIDNLIFIALVVAKLPPKNRKLARVFGLSLALIIRILMLLTLSWVMSLTEPIFSLSFVDFSYKALLLIAGGLFLIGKSGNEIYQDISDNIHTHKTDKKDSNLNHKKSRNSLFAAVAQITVIDFIFSFDSVITAVGMTNNIPVIIAAIIISMIIMLISSEHVSMFLSTYPSLKIIALSFIFLIGVILLADGFGMEVSKGYLYFALFFTLTVEVLNIISKKRFN